MDEYLAKYLKDRGNSQQMCSAARNSVARTYELTAEGFSNETTCLLLKQRFDEYSYLMHTNDSEPDSICGIKKQTERLLLESGKSDPILLSKSKLGTSHDTHVAMLKDELKKMAHCGIANNLPCDKNKVSTEDLEWLKREKTLPSMESVTNRLLNSNPNVSNIEKRTKSNTNLVQNPNVCPNIQVRPTDSFKTVHPRPTKGQDNLKNINNQPAEEKQKFCGDFKTAYDELKIQNLKKYGNENHNIPQYGENSKKKSLGSRSVTGKFVPPVGKNDENDTHEEKIDDERLKHIDPKMIELIMSEIIDRSASIGWDDIAGLEFAKNVIQEAVVWPLLRPDIFTGLRKPPKGILLFGPPGTGKTLIGKCIASQCKATFFSISASSLTSKWIGEGEKMVRALFAVARSLQPSVVFIDEIDSLLTQRSNEEHESSRRIKTEFLVQLDGASIGDDDRILFIGATNRPQELDEAARRRLVKRLYIPLPDIAARIQIIEKLMQSEKHLLSQNDIVDVANLADGFSGADVRSLCAEAALGPIRSVSFTEIHDIKSEQVRPVTKADFTKALTRVRPSVSQDDLDGYVKWNLTFGSGNTH